MIRLQEDRDLNAVLPGVMKYMEQFRGISGSKYLVSISWGQPGHFFKTYSCFE